jgi:hypothetical protein
LNQSKICNSCGEELPLDRFKVEKRNKSGVSSKCKICAGAYSKNWKEKHPKEYAKVLWRCRLKKEYGITEEDYDIMYKKQDGVCAICGKPETRFSKGKITLLCVDHNHETGEVRGLLCHRCNVALGSFNSDELLEKAKNYLEKYKIKGEINVTRSS